MHKITTFLTYSLFLLIFVVGCQAPIPNSSNNLTPIPLLKQSSVTQNYNNALPLAGGYWDGRYVNEKEAKDILDGKFKIQDYPTPNSQIDQPLLSIYRDLNVNINYFMPKYGMPSSEHITTQSPVGTQNIKTSWLFNYSPSDLQTLPNGKVIVSRFWALFKIDLTESNGFSRHFEMEPQVYVSSNGKDYTYGGPLNTDNGIATYRKFVQALPCNQLLDFKPGSGDRLNVQGGSATIDEVNKTVRIQANFIYTGWAIDGERFPAAGCDSFTQTHGQESGSFDFTVDRFFVQQGPPPISLELETSPEYISPKNQDGNFDNGTFEVTASSSQNWTLTVGGKTFNGTGTQTVQWDGTNDGGTFVDDGEYTIELTSGSETKTGTIKVDNTEPQISDIRIADLNGMITVFATVEEIEVNGVKTGLDSSSIRVKSDILEMNSSPSYNAATGEMIFEFEPAFGSIFDFQLGLIDLSVVASDIIQNNSDELFILQDLKFCPSKLVDKLQSISDVLDEVTQGTTILEGGFSTQAKRNTLTSGFQEQIDGLRGAFISEQTQLRAILQGRGSRLNQVKQDISKLKTDLKNKTISRSEFREKVDKLLIEKKSVKSDIKEAKTLLKKSQKALDKLDKLNTKSLAKCDVKLGPGIRQTNLKLDTKNQNKHLPGTKEADKALKKTAKGKDSTHLFNDKATADAVKDAIFERGIYLGKTRSSERYGLYFSKPIGTRYGPDGSSQLLRFGEVKVNNGKYHVVPRVSPPRLTQ